MELERLDNLSLKWANSTHFHEIKISLLFLLDTSLLVLLAPLPLKGRVIKEYKQKVLKINFLDQKKDKFCPACISLQFPVIRFIAIFSLEGNTWVIKLLTHRSSETKIITKVCYLQENMITIHPQSRFFLNHINEETIELFRWWANFFLPGWTPAKWRE